MGLFTSSQKGAAEETYSRMKPYLAKKDGNKHIIMVNSFSKLGNQNFDCDSKYTTEIDFILSAMQVDGYEILDIKFNSITGQGLTGNRTGFNTVILYK